MSRKEYVYKEVEGGEPLVASVWYKPGGSDTPKPIGESHMRCMGYLTILI